MGSSEWAILPIRHSPLAIRVFGRIGRFRPVFAPVCLDSVRSQAISPQPFGAGFLAPLVFARNSTCKNNGTFPKRVRSQSRRPITTDQKAGPDLIRGRDRTRRDQTMFAVIKTGGRQYRVVPDDVFEIGKIEGDVGSIVQLGEVLVLGGDTPVLGTPAVAGASVAAEVLQHKRGRRWSRSSSDAARN